jgi:hypothetical protein
MLVVAEQLAWYWRAPCPASPPKTAPPRSTLSTLRAVGNWTSALSQLACHDTSFGDLPSKMISGPESAPPSLVCITGHSARDWHEAVRSRPKRRASLDGATFSPWLVNQRSARRNNKSIPLDLRAIDQDIPNDQNVSHQDLVDMQSEGTFTFFAGTPPKDCSDLRRSRSG